MLPGQLALSAPQMESKLVHVKKYQGYTKVPMIVPREGSEYRSQELTKAHMKGILQERLR